MTWHFGAIWEAIADAQPDAPALVCGSVRRSWRAFDHRAARIAGALEAAGLARGFRAGLYASNCNEYSEAQFGIFKAGGGPINVNYRYSEAELVYLLENAECEALFFDARFAPRVAAILGELPRLKFLAAIDDGSGGALEGASDLEALIASHAPAPRRSYDEDDVYMFYTGGTTGMPKGVMMRQGDFSRGITAAFATGVRGLPAPESLEGLAEIVRGLAERGEAPIALPACPLMHGTGAWGGAFGPHAAGGVVVTLRGEHFDPAGLWRAAAAERVSDLVIVGDAFAKPMLAALRSMHAAGEAPDLRPLKRILSSGVMFSREVKEGLLELLDVTIVDVMGSTEGGMGSSIVSRANPPGETARFLPSPGVKVFNENDEEVKPGSDEIGMVASAGASQLGYFKDEAKTARTFRTIGGVRYSFPGDFGKVAADGSLILLGRGSVCINTGGEKVFPEEVEEALKAHPSVFDCLVVGVPDPRFGERVTAVLSLRDGQGLDEAALFEHARRRVAGYKLPRRLVVVDRVQRAPNGKADYKWAKAAALEAEAAEGAAAAS